MAPAYNATTSEKMGAGNLLIDAEDDGGLFGNLSGFEQSQGFRDRRRKSGKYLNRTFGWDDDDI